MTGRERLMATLRGEPVDRPAVSFYEIGGWRMNPDDPDPYNICNDPSWRPLLELAEETDLIRHVGPTAQPGTADPSLELSKHESWEEGMSRFTRTTLTVGRRTLTSLTRRDAEINTVWRLEHLLKDAQDLRAYLDIPDKVLPEEYDVTGMVQMDEELGDRGIVMMDTADPICAAAELFSMADYTVIAFTEHELFHRLLDKVSRPIYHKVEQVSAAFPGHMWRICGPEYATEPYLPPCLFEEYVVRYTKPIVEMIEKRGGFARIHCHGQVKKCLAHFVAMGASATDPIEPPPQGDVELDYVRREYGRDLVLFGNIEVSEIENTPPAEFEKRVAKALKDGTAGEGRGFVLMPTSAPYGRRITATTMANYETMLRLTRCFGN